MRSLLGLRKIWTFEQYGSRAEQLQKYLVQVQQEMFNQSLCRNVIATASTLAVHYCFTPTISVGLLFGVGTFHLYSHYQFHKASFDVLGYTSSQKHLLKTDYSLNVNISQTHQQSTTESGFSQFENNNLAKQQDGSQGEFRYVQIEHSEERLKHYSRTLICTGLLQGLFLGGTGTFWLGEYPEVIFMMLAIAGNSILNSFTFKNVYSNSNSLPGLLKIHLLGTLIPALFIIGSPILFNNAFLQSNLLKQAQAVFLENQNIKQDPVTFLMRRKGIRIFGIVFFYILTLANLTGDPTDEDGDEEEEDEIDRRLNKMMKNILKYDIKYEIVHDKNKDQEQITEQKKESSSE